MMLTGSKHVREARTGRHRRQQLSLWVFILINALACAQPDSNDHHTPLVPLPQTPPSLGVVGSQALPSLRFARDWETSSADYCVHSSAARTASCLHPHWYGQISIHHLSGCDVVSPCGLVFISVSLMVSVPVLLALQGSRPKIPKTKK